ncbi:Holliday junction branch migration protein RuvA [Candidatus Gracilibacteria bacterium]|nr:Holliday junction branch migration protein RuvA [Candidatus Gracilibacteria bacterium]
MIGRLVGIVENVDAKEILLCTTGGVGYTVHPAGSLLSRCKKGASLSAEILTIVRENEISLYGFGDQDEKKLFEKLISVSGIGPRTALQMVSIPPSQFMKAIEEGDISFLTRIPGLGKKTAERLVIELRGKLDLTQSEVTPHSPALEEAFDALQNLGYDRHTIGKRLEKADPNTSAEDLVKFFLRSNA